MYKNTFVADYLKKKSELNNVQKYLCCGLHNTTSDIYIHWKKIRNSTVSTFNVTRPSLLFSTNSNVSVKSNCFKCKYNNMSLYNEDH